MNNFILYIFNVSFQGFTIGGGMAVSIHATEVSTVVDMAEVLEVLAEVSTARATTAKT